MNIFENCWLFQAHLFQSAKNYSIGKMNPSSYPLHKIHNDVVCYGKAITPMFFSILLTMVQIRDHNILTRSCTVMHKKSPNRIAELFKGFLIQLRQQFPVQMQEWNVKQRQLFNVKTKLVHFLERQFSRDWVKFVKRAILETEAEEDNSRRRRKLGEFLYKIILCLMKYTVWLLYRFQLRRFNFPFINFENPLYFLLKSTTLA